MTGLFGIVSAADCGRTLMFGTDYHSHLGSQQGGIATRRDDGIMDRRLHRIDQNPFKSKFYADSEKMRGRRGIGAISDKDTQPIFKVHGNETYAIATSGMVTNLEQLAEEICSRKGKGRGDVFFRNNSDGSLSMTEVVAELINLEPAFLDGIERMYERIEGSCSLLILNGDGIYAARDLHGRTSLVLGRGEKGVAVTSETCAFPNLGFRVEKFLRPGEVVLMRDDGVRTMREGDDSQMQICSFLYIYTSDPSTSHEGINVQEVRQRCGSLLAEGDAELKVDIVSGVPDSGINHSHGYLNKRVKMAMRQLREAQKGLFIDFMVANRELLRSGDFSREYLESLLETFDPEAMLEANRPPFYADPLIKYRAAYGRSYTPPDQRQRDEVAWNKLLPVGHILADGWDDVTRESVRGRSILLTDDSIVRNTQLRNSVRKLWDYGAGEIHVRVACPPLTSPCRYLRSTRTTAELAASRAIEEIEGGAVGDIREYLDQSSQGYARMVEMIRKDLGVTTLRYLSLDQVVKAIEMPEERLCVDCWK
ncbi:amidophosphoribosyltransferase [Candidatus Woesearchaeota archaeon]|nr:amidophosphoribosyltransferase [Candidatus Woesearchaeota archaeon]